MRTELRVAQVIGRLIAVAAVLALADAFVLGAHSAAQSPVAGGSAPQSVPTLTAKVMHTYPHDAHAFTQGLEYYEGFLYESTGETGQSSVRKVALESGKVLRKTDLAAEYFGEG